MRQCGIALALVLAACSSERREPKPPITIFAAASLARPLAALTDSFQRRAAVPSLPELGGSMEQSRKITDLARVPDVLILVDDDVIAALVPTHLEWYVRFATNKLVVAYTDKSHLAHTLTADNWWQVLSRPDVRIGRADPTVAPVGRHALELLRRVDGYYKRSRLGDTLLARASLRYVRPNATELAALLETGEVDFIVDYESVARQYGFKFVSLPDDLAPPVLYGVSVPPTAAHPTSGIEFVAYLLSEDGKRVLRDAQIQVLRTPVAIGVNVPSSITELVRTATAPAVAP
jgi:molybdate/tungstate transport system substrate-binding protein